MLKIVENTYIEGTLCKDVPMDDIPKVYAKNYKDMVKAMSTGVGLAAPQVGIFQRFFIMKLGENIIPIFNPKVTFMSPQKTPGKESCLSYPVEGAVTMLRAKVTSFDYLDEAGCKASMTLKGWDARIFQHEFDHLNGLTIHYRGK